MNRIVSRPPRPNSGEPDKSRTRAEKGGETPPLQNFSFLPAPQNWGGGAFLLVALLCAGCAPKQPPPPAPPLTAASNATPAAASKQITLDWTPKQPRSLDPIQFTVHLFGAEGQPQSAGKVSLSIAMPTMDMGKNVVPLKATAPGVYVGTGRFSMAGDWWATVTVGTGGVVKTVVIPISVK